MKRRKDCRRTKLRKARSRKQLVVAILGMMTYRRASIVYGNEVMRVKWFITTNVFTTMKNWFGMPNDRMQAPVRFAMAKCQVHFGREREIKRKLG